MVFVKVSRIRCWRETDKSYAACTQLCAVRGCTALVRTWRARCKHYHLHR